MQKGSAASEHVSRLTVLLLLGNLEPVPISDTNSIISNIAWQQNIIDTRGMKRTVQVNVKMSPEDFNLLKRAAEKRWPEAVMTNSGIVLGLAKIAAKSTLAHP